jgi:HAD superfamily hydrolase (TIGR01509 family)
MIQGAIFDVDGTLLDSMPIWMEAGANYLRTKNREPEACLGDKLFTMSMKEAAVYLKSTYEISDSTEEIMMGINHVIEKFYYEQAQLKEGVKAFLTQMYDAGIAMTIATATDIYLVEHALERLKVRHLFQHIFTCTDVGAGKEKPRIYYAARNSMHTQTEKTWVFEDAIHALLTAKKAGFPTVGIYDEASKDSQFLLEKEADLYWKQWKSFSTFCTEVR